MSQYKVHHVLLSGGVGSRLWPLSRKSKPKQYINLFDSKSLFEMTLERNLPFSAKITVVGNVKNNHLSHEILERFPNNEVTYIVESTPRNTAPAIAFAAFSAEPDDILLVTPSDHIINADQMYTKAIDEATALANQGYIVTFGVKPLYPETGYGYIEYKNNDVVSFREKPSQQVANEFIEKGNFLWNSGIFCFKAVSFLTELAVYAPEIYKKSLEAWKSSRDGVLNEAVSKQIPSLSIDYAVLEKSNKIKVVLSEFEWSDMGSFEAIYDFLKQRGHPVDEFGNMAIGTDKLTSFLGMENTILVYTDDALLVLSKKSSQNVKEVFEYLEQNNASYVM